MTNKSMKVRNFFATNWDYLLIILFSLIFSLIRMYTDNWVATILGLIILFFLPGYCFTNIIYIKTRKLKRYIKFTISIISSFIITASIGLILYLASNINLTIAIWLMFSVISCLAITGTVLRVVIKDSNKPFVINSTVLSKVKEKWKNYSMLTKGLSFVTILILIGAFISLVYFIQYSFPITTTTSLSITDQNGEPISGIRTAVNEEIELGIKILNSELKSMNYFVEVWICNQTFANIDNNNSANINLTLVYSNEIFLLNNEVNHSVFNFTISNVGVWYIIPIVFKEESPIAINYAQGYSEIINDIMNSRIFPVIEMNESNILGTWIQAKILNYIKFDDGNSFSKDNWLVSSTGWNWSILSDGSNYAGIRHDGYLELYSNDTGSELRLETKINEEEMYQYINRAGIEVRLAPSTNLEAFDYFGISLEINYDENHTIEAQLLSNTTHLILGFDNLESIGVSNYQKTLVAYNWTQDAFHDMKIYADFDSSWITFTCDNLTYRSAIQDEQYVTEANQVSVILKNKDSYSNSSLMIDNFIASWEDKPVPIFNINNYRADNGNLYGDNWYTSSQGWNWEIDTNSGSYSGNRDSGIVNFTNFDDNSYLALQTGLSEDLFIKTGNKLILKANITYFSNASNYNSFGISLDLESTSINYRAVILSNTTHLLMGISSLFTFEGIFYTQSIIPFNWSLGEFHELQINVDFSGKWVAFICDTINYRLTISDSIYVIGYNRATVVMDTANVISQSILGITNFKISWEDWFNPEEIASILNNHNNQNVIISKVSNNPFVTIGHIEIYEAIERIKKVDVIL